MLSAPLFAGRGREEAKTLALGEYNKLAQRLGELQKTPADLIAPDSEKWIEQCANVVCANRLRTLLARGFLLAQAARRWQARAIWFFGRGDGEYPRRIKERLRARAPAVLFGCGEPALLESGGLAVVGSREINEELAEYARGAGELAARAGAVLISGAARGADLSAMRGALENGGSAAGVLAHGLERAATHSEHREMLADGRLVLVSPCDPGAGFAVGRAMERNKLIYALADAALVVHSAEGAGGTWAGATEQLNSLRLAPIYVRAEGGERKGLAALQKKGALPWPAPDSPQSLKQLLASRPPKNNDAPLFA